MTPRLRSQEDGLSLIELLVAVVVLSVGGVAVLGALATVITSTDSNRSSSSAEVITRDFAEAVKNKALTATTFPVCAGAASLTPGSLPAPWTLDGPVWTVTIGKDSYRARIDDDIEYWKAAPDDQLAGDWADCAAYDPRCDDTTLPACDSGTQRVGITIDSERTGVNDVVQNSRIIIRRGNAG